MAKIINFDEARKKRIPILAWKPPVYGHVIWDEIDPLEIKSKSQLTKEFAQKHGIPYNEIKLGPPSDE